jgi:hypothetical protein
MLENAEQCEWLPAPNDLAYGSPASLKEVFERMVDANGRVAARDDLA